MTEGEPLSAKVRWSDDIGARGIFARHLLSHEPGLKEALRRERRKTLLRQLAGVVPGLFIAGLIAGETGVPMAFLVGCVAWAVWAAAMLAFKGPWQRTRDSLLSTARKFPEPKPRATEGWLVQEGLRVESETTRALLKWNTFDHVERVEGFVFFQTRESLDALYIPTSSFASDEEVERFIAAAREGMIRAGAHESQRLPALLAETKLVCPSCRQPLKGLHEPRCPECGAGLTARTLWILNQL